MVKGERVSMRQCACPHVCMRAWRCSKNDVLISLSLNFNMRRSDDMTSKLPVTHKEGPPFVSTLGRDQGSQRRALRQQCVKRGVAHACSHPCGAAKPQPCPDTQDVVSSQRGDRDQHRTAVQRGLRGCYGECVCGPAHEHQA